MQIKSKYKSILITGISSGIGEGLATYYAKQNCRLFGCARNEERINKVKEECINLGATHVDFHRVDIADKNSLKAWLSSIIENNDIDLIILNAGVSAGTAGTDIEKEEQVERIFNINLYGVLYCLNLIVPYFINKKKGQIAIVSSLAALRGLPSAPSYSASKAAVKAYAEALRPLLKPDNIGVTLIMPGFVDSRITEKNKFPMPFIMSKEKAANIIGRQLEKNPPIIAFPFIMYMQTLLISLLPRRLGDFICSKLPRKKSM